MVEAESEETESTQEVEVMLVASVTTGLLWTDITPDTLKKPAFVTSITGTLSLLAA